MVQQLSQICRGCTSHVSKPRSKVPFYHASGVDVNSAVVLVVASLEVSLVVACRRHELHESAEGWLLIIFHDRLYSSSFIMNEKDRLNASFCHQRSIDPHIELRPSSSRHQV